MEYESIVSWTRGIISQYSMALTLRQIYYRLISQHPSIPNTKSTYNMLSKILVKARERGDIPEDVIEDRSRETIGGEGWTWDSPDDFLEYVMEDFSSKWMSYSRSLWASQPCYVEVWVEKDALSRIISDAVDGFRVRTAPSRGYSSFTYVRDAVKRFEGLPNRWVVILHFSDHDPSGLDMTRDLQERFDRYGNGLEIHVERVALTYEQVQKYGLPPNPTKRADTRSKGYISRYGDGCWELDAIEPDELQRMVRASVAKHIVPEVWKGAVDREEQERERLRVKFEEFTRLLKGNDHD